jgi:hypothetical protein
LRSKKKYFIPLPASCHTPAVYKVWRFGVLWSLDHSIEQGVW